MITHAVNRSSLDEFLSEELEIDDPIIGYYFELRKNGSLKGSYITEKNYKNSCPLEQMIDHIRSLSHENPRVWKNIPIELYLKEYKNFMSNACHKMHRQWMSISYDDIYQMFSQSLVNCYNKGGYILNSRLIMRSFYNLVYSFIRKNYNFLVNTISMDEPVYISEDEEEICMIDMIEDVENNPDYIMEEQELERESREKLSLVKKTLNDLGYSDRVYKNILFELEKRAQSRDTRRIIEKVKERLRRDAWI